MEERHTQGGKRQGAGRPRKEPTQVVRVPYSLLDKVNAMIEEYRGNEVQRQTQKVTHTVKKDHIHKQPKEIQYKCGCTLNGILFRRANGCRLERLSH